MFNIYMFANYKYGFIAVVKNSVDPDQKPADLDLYCFQKGIECKNMYHFILLSQYTRFEQHLNL